MVHSLNKGKRAEREIAKLLGDLLGTPCRRSQQHAGGTDSADVVGIDGLHIEVKHQERMRLYEWIAQAENDCGGNLPVVMHRANQKQWLCTVPLEMLLSLAIIIGKHASHEDHSLQSLARVDRVGEDQQT